MKWIYIILKSGGEMLVEIFNDYNYEHYVVS